MREITDNQACEYANELISLVYGELSVSDSQEFKLHLNTCHQCSAELESFGEMRDAIGAWKHESLASVYVPNETPLVRQERKKSAIGALREFFDLSPLWMKGAVGLATMLFCIFAIVAAGRLSVTKPVPPNQASVKTYDQQQVDAMIAKVRAELSTTKDSQTISDQPQELKPVHSNKGNRHAVAPASARNRRPLSKAEREQLAADLRLASSRSDDAVDLISDRINE